MQSSDRTFPPAILVIEDDPALLSMVEQLLSWQGYRVLAAVSVEAARAAESSYAGPIPLIVSDVHLGSARGPELVRFFRARRDGIAVIYMSGHEQGRALDADDLEPGDAFMRKPFSLREMQTRVQSVMALAGTRA